MTMIGDRKRYKNFSRGMRVPPSVPKDTVVIPPPPEPTTYPSQQSWLVTIAPFISGILIGLVAWFVYHNFFMLIMTGVGATVYSSIMLYTRIRQNRDHKQEQETIEEIYTKKLVGLEEQLAGKERLQVERLNDLNPGMDTLKGWAENVQPRLWERRIEHDDFLRLRFATGAKLPSVQVVSPKIEYPDPDLVPEMLLKAHQLGERYRRDLSSVPITIDLREIGSIAIAGEPGLVEGLVMRLVNDIVIQHAPSEIELYAVLKPGHEDRWEWLKWLPHTSAIRAGDGRRHIAFTAEDASRMLASLLEEFHLRELKQERRSQRSKHIVLFVEDYQMVRGEETINRILHDGDKVNASSIIIVPSASQTPDGCGGVIEVDEAVAQLKTQAGLSRYTAGKPEIATPSESGQIARNLAKVVMVDEGYDELPVDVRLLNLLGYKDVDDLNIKNAWTDALQRPPTLQTTIGLKRGQQPERLCLRQDAHGPHGLIAGTSGSGKSELLLTMLIGLALNHHPQQLNFVLVDYKGGTSMSRLKELPHTVGFVTDLDGLQTRRALEALESEIQRREVFLDRYQVTDLDKYYEQGHDEVMPYLFIVIDEFAELRARFIKEDLSDLMKQFISLAQKGRALGIHLILAMQSPEGIVDDKIRANMKFRICLRVEKAIESRSILGKSDAHELPSDKAGRAYFQVGSDDIYDIFQVARVEGRYREGEGAAIDDFAFWEIAPDGEDLLLYETTSSQTDEVENEGTAILTDAQIIASESVNAANALDFVKLTGPWPPPLPESINLVDLMERDSVPHWDGKEWPSIDIDSSHSFSVPVGLMDEPQKQRQLLLNLDLTDRANNVLIFGEPKSGKTTFVKSAVMSLALTHSPEDVHMHLIDFGGGQMVATLGNLPHVAGTYLRNETDKVRRLLYILQNELSLRQRLFSEVGSPDLKAYLRNTDNEKIPLIFVVIDNLTAFRTSFMLETDQWGELLRDAGAYGLCFLMTTDKPPPDSFLAPVRARGLYKFDRSFTSSLLAQRVDLSRYHFGPGRGLWNVIPALEFQTALPIDGAMDHQNVRLQEMAQSMNATWSGSRPKQVTLLDANVPFSHVITSEMMTEWQEFNAFDKLSIPIGLEDKTHNPYQLNLFQDSAYFLITGPPRSGKATALTTIMISLALSFKPEDLHLILFGTKSSHFEVLGSLPHVLESISDEGELDTFKEKFKEVMDNRRAAIKSTPRTQLLRPLMLFVIDDYRSLVNIFGSAVSDLLVEELKFGSRQGCGLVASMIESSIHPTFDNLHRELVRVRSGLWVRPTDTTMAAQIGAKIPQDIKGKQLPVGRSLLFGPHYNPQPVLQVASINIGGEGIEQGSIEDWVALIADKVKRGGNKPANWGDYGNISGE